MRFSLCAFVTLLIGLVAAQIPTTNTATDTAAIAAAQATAVTDVDTSHKPGKVFDRIMIILLENTDFQDALDDRQLIPHYISLITRY
jgi:hypothetical protein